MSEPVEVSTWEGLCLRCPGRRVALSHSAVDALGMVSQHYIDCHAFRGGMLEQDTDFTLGPAPERCDLCSTLAERPYWTYRTGEGLPAEDPLWLICDPCAELVEAAEAHEGLVKLYTRMVNGQAVITGRSKDELREPMARQAVQFCLHRVERRRDKT